MKWLRALYDWTMAKAAHPHAERWLAFFAFVESSFFPIPPHPLLGLMCLAEPKKALRFAFICTAFSVLGGIFGYAIGYFLYEAIGEWLIGVLGLSEAFPKAACYLRENDWQAILIAGTTPIPFKLLTITAGFISMDFVTFLLASIGGRGLVFMVVGVLFQLFGAPIKTFVDKYLGWLTALFTVLLIGGFLILTQLGGGEGGSDDPCGNVTSIER
ncbi:YqaA family protein [Alteraurantiacibacter aquimixticola]|uniref:DedA family protein n=1 Tax=Alteraurantiacibacter aquimixticola TaxID=2489173 RepID=A0A4T3EXZ8_9SPHN|nr:YqaA family protein [Alteraurantiacibacter aquimixticola]TIX49391.1 DedA family protein [Alteraurantiacibacter aquimixticola]